MRNTLFIADSHLQEFSPEKEAFFRFLDRISCSEYDVVFLGDIFELWLGLRSYEDGIHLRFLEWCRKEKLRRNVWFLEGNHEFYLSGRRDAFTGFSRSGLFLDDGKLFVVHGDTINSHDHGYTLFRMVTRNFFARSLAFLAGPFFGRSATDRIRLGMKGQNLIQKKYFPHPEMEKLSQKLSATGVRIAVCGHFHRNETEGIFHALPNWKVEEPSVGIYHPGIGTFEILKCREIFPDE